AGPMAVPGAYQLKLTVGEKSYTAPLELKADPRISATADDLQKQYDLLIRIRARVSEAHTTINEIRAVRTQLTALRRQLNQNEQKQILEAMSALDKAMTPIEEKLLQVKSRSSQDPLNFPVMLNDQLMGLGRTVDSADAAPTKQALERYDDLVGQLNPLVAGWKKLRDGELAALNDRIQKASIPRIAITAPSSRQ
ncbi:MAG: glycosyl hydrolase, partial [Candidatus Acidiferrales bacterium]